MSGQNAANKSFNPLDFIAQQSKNLKAYVSTLTQEI